LEIFETYKFSFFPVKRTDYILDTDYSSWAVVFDCKMHEGNQSTHLYWLLSRTPKLTTDEKSLSRIAALKSKYINLTEIRIVPMKDEKCGGDSFAQ
jgi:Lipocalin / cytosolic fatty-acid binding protein family